MSTEIQDPALPEGFTLTQFSGGTNRPGPLVQLTGPMVWGEHHEGFSQMVQLTPVQARAVAVALLSWAESVDPVSKPIPAHVLARLQAKVANLREEP